jgi:membrane-associated phospholipid phosphatase
MNKDSPRITRTDSPTMESNLSLEAPIITNLENGDADLEIPGSSPTIIPDLVSSPARSYWCSYKFVEVLFCFLPVPIGVFLEFATPHQRPIPYQGFDDIGEIVLAFMYNVRESGETVSSLVMFCSAFVIPFVLQLLLICGSKTRFAFDKKDMIHKTVCVYVLSLGLTQTLTNAAKLYVGYLRPIFFDLCQPDEDFQECTSSNGLAAESHQARVSFPSGHASLSVCGLLVFSLFLEDSFGKTAYEKKGRTTTTTTMMVHQQPIKLVRILSVLCYAPMLLAYFIRRSCFVFVFAIVRYD